MQFGHIDSNQGKWQVNVRYVDNPAGPLKGKITLDEKPKHMDQAFGPFGRCFVTSKRPKKVQGG